MAAMTTEPAAEVQLEIVQQVTTSVLSDGMIVRLSGDIGDDQLPALRGALLSALPAACRDVVVDAGDVTAIDPDGLAVLFAAWAWTEEHDRRFLLSRTSAAFETALAAHGVQDDLPRLAPLSRPSRLARLPRQRSLRD